MNSTTSEGPTVTTATTPTSSSAAADSNLSNNKPTTTLATAVAVDDRTVVVADPVVSAMDNNKNDQKQKRKKQTTNVIVTVVGLLVLMTVVVLSVLLTQKGGTNNNNKDDETGISSSTNNGSSSSSSSSLDDSTKNNNNNNITPQDENSGGSLFLGDDSGSTETLELLYQQRTKDMISILESLYEDSEGGIQVFDVSSPFASEDRIAALEWIVKEDPSKIAIPTTTTTQQTTTDEQQGQIYKVRQRYVLALLYMATNGQDWDKQYNFLAAGIDECQWTSIHNSEGMETVINPDDGYNGNVKGAICNDKGQLEKIVMYWNGMSGTLPHELSLFSETLKELNIAGGSISGQIPSSITKLKRLENLSLSDNCLTGELPQEMNHIDMPNLSVLGVHMNNYGMTAFSGNMGSFCDGNGALVDGVVAVAIDCPPEQFVVFESDGDTTTTTTTTTSSNSTLADVSPWGCDCCLCCNPDKFQCQNLVNKDPWQVHFLDEISSNGYPKGFDTQCVSSEQESWIAENCPCLINVTTDPSVWPFRGSCTTDCSQEGAIPSYDFGS